MPSSFVHLHVHTEYSLLDGFSKIPKLVDRAKELEMSSLAITDHGALYGVIDFFNTAKEAGIKPLIGMEAYLASRTMKRRPEEDKKSSHLLLLAENQTGYQNLLRLASAAQLEGFYYFPRIDRDFLAAHSEGLIATSGCLSAEVPRSILKENLAEARSKLDWYYQVFGQDRFFLELQHHEIPELHKVNKVLQELGTRYQARYVATNDVHYVNRTDARLQDILLCVQTGSLYTESKRMRMSGDDFYLRSSAEMESLFSEVPGALSNTLLIAERCEVDLSNKGYHLPKFDVPDGYTTKTYFRELCEEGLPRRYPGREKDAAITERLDKELEIIDKMGFNAYFLIVWDLCRHAKELSIWYSRGSAAGSIAAYLLDITLVEPLAHGLIFERFLNVDRISMPDIDLDFQDDKRSRMLEYATQRYGDDRVAAIITFNKLKAHAAVRDVGRVMDVPLNEVDRVAKLIPNIPGKPMTIAEALVDIKELAEEYKNKPFVKELIDTAQQMEGVIRGAGTHAAGVVIADKPTLEYVPLNRPTGQSAEETPIKVLTQFEMSTLESLGMLKVDFLGLSTLTIMQRACDLIKERRGVDLNLYNIPTDDKETYELLGRGETAGVFQFEGAGMRRWMMQMKPHALENAVAMVALFRPGPMDFIPKYIDRMHGIEKVTYAHPALENIFRETFGIPVYQEQLMQAVMQVAGYSASEADDLRKAIAKKIEGKLKKHRKKFVEGAVKLGIPRETAEAIFSEWENFARYGFNKAHAADYGLIAVQTAYLKVHFAVEYMTALLSVSQGDTDKVAFYVADCRRMGIDTLPPDINASMWDFSVQDREGASPAIRFGLGAIKNVGQGAIEAILKGRGNKPFVNLLDFAHRADLRQVGKRALECLIKAGAMDFFGSRHALLEAADQIISTSGAHFDAHEAGQLTFFEGAGALEQIIVLVAHDDQNEFTRRERLNWERELIGLYVSDHPLSPMMKELSTIVTHFSGQLAMLEGNERVRLAGLVKSFRSFQTKRGKDMAFVTIEDPQGVMDLVLFPTVWERFSGLVQYDKLIVIEGKMDAQNNEGKILVDKVENKLNIVVASRPAEVLGQTPTEAAKAEEPKLAQEVEEIIQETEEMKLPSLATPNLGASLANNTQNPQEERPIAFAAADDLGDIPEPPDLFPLDWEILVEEHSSFAKVEPVAVAEPIQIPEPALTADYAVTEDEPAPGVATEIANTAVIEFGAGLSAVVSTTPTDPGPLPFITPPPSQAPRGDRPVRMATIYLRSKGDKTRDILYMRRVHGALISYPGIDRFAFYVFEGRSGYLLEFPNDTTDLNDDLVHRLEQMLGTNNLRVEDVTFQ